MAITPFPGEKIGLYVKGSPAPVAATMLDADMAQFDVEPPCGPYIVDDVVKVVFDEHNYPWAVALGTREPIESLIARLENLRRNASQGRWRQTWDMPPRPTEDEHDGAGGLIRAAVSQSNSDYIASVHNRLPRLISEIRRSLVPAPDRALNQTKDTNRRLKKENHRYKEALETLESDLADLISGDPAKVTRMLSDVRAALNGVEDE